MTLRILKKPLELVKAASTRFKTYTLVGERLLRLQPALQAAVVDPKYAAMKYKDTGNTIEDGGTGRRSYSNKGATCKKLIIDEDGFWVRVSAHVTATLPIFKFLRRVDTGSPTLGKLYSGWFELGEFLKGSTSDFKEVALDKWLERWAYGHRDVAAAAYVVDPEFHAHDQSSNPEVTNGFMSALEKISILLEVRRIHGSSDELSKTWKLRSELITKDPKSWKGYEHFPKYPNAKSPAVKLFCRKVCEQLVLYRDRKGVFASDWVFEAAETMPAHVWWDTYGSSVLELQIFARLLLSQPSSASICERINSEFAFVKDPRRNRLKHNRTNKLVALFHHLRLLFRMKKPNYSEPVVAWNEEDKHTGLVKYGVNHYEDSASSVNKIPCPTRPPVIFVDHDVHEQDEADSLSLEMAADPS